MADIAASDITYSLVSQRKEESGYKRIVLDVSFGDGALTYPTGGVVLAKGSLGVPNHLEDLNIIESNAGNGFLYKFDISALALRIYQSDAVAASTHTHDLHLNDGDVADGATTRVNAGTDLLGANTGGDLLVSGVADTTGAGGIVQATIAANAAGALAELSGGVDAPAAATLRVEAVGW